MDHSEGFQIPAGVLPQVSVLKPGLALIFKAPQMDVRQLNAHIEHLDKQLQVVYPSFTTVAVTGEWESLHNRLVRLRTEALKNKRVIFAVCDPFSPRELTLRGLADHVFSYAKGISPHSTVFQKVKANGAVSMTLGYPVIEVISVTDPKKVVPLTRISFDLPEGVDQDTAETKIKEVLQSLTPVRNDTYQFSARGPEYNNMAWDTFANYTPRHHKSPPKMRNLVGDLRHRSLNWRGGVCGVLITKNEERVLEIEAYPFEDREDFVARCEREFIRFYEANNLEIQA